MYHINLILTLLVCAIGLVGCILPSLAVVGAYAVIVQFCVIVIPVTVMEFVLTNHPFDKRKRRYYFTEKHNSDDHESLF